MVWQYSPYYIAFLACGCITLILAVTGWRNRSFVCAKPFALLMLAASLWSFGAALEVSSADIQGQMFALLIQYPGIVTVPVAWLLFSFEYSGREHWITPNNLVLLFIVPAISVIMVATNNIHHLFYTSVTEHVVGGAVYADISYGPFFWFNTIYSFLLTYIAIMIILQRFVFTQGLYRGQIIAILIAVFTPFFVNLAYAIRQINFTVIDPTPFAFVISGFAILIGIARYQLLDITPMAQDQVIANMSDGMIVLDVQDRIISLNGPAERFIGMKLVAAVGTPIETLLPCTIQKNTEPSGLDDVRAEQVYEIERVVLGTPHYFELRCSPILSRIDEVKGRIIMIRDITNQKMGELALALARKKINLLASITRHDILNQVTVLLLNIDTLKDEVKEPQLRELIRVQEAAVENIRHQIEFARDYETIGGKAPQWMNIHDIYRNIFPVMETYGITFFPLEKDIDVYADQLLERVFYNLVDNSIRHGEHVTTISARCQETSEGILLLYEDNGVGVPRELKKKIFERGFGKHTGLGLFLAREILEITGLSIQETGVPGIGVRFEIAIPKAQYRIRRG
jgi:PAS domain S-box-containing protein